MELISLNKNNDFSSLKHVKYEKCTIKEEKKDSIEDDEPEFSIYNFILFIILIIIIIIIIIFLTIGLLYKYIIKYDLEKSKKNRHPELFLGYKEKLKIQKYVNDCINGTLYDTKKYTKPKNPKISIIIPIYNKEKFILRIARSIQNQSLKDIEIIFCDDNSYDNSTKIILELQKEDERIILNKHNINQGTLINRLDGAKISKGEYLLFIDGDDLLVNNILEKVYLKAKENNTDIIQYKTYYGDFDKYFYCSDIKRKKEVIYQPEISSLMYYENGILHQTEYNIWGKLIKKNFFFEAIKCIDEYYLKQNMSLHEDGLILFMLFKKAKSYIFLDEFGLLYFWNEFSTMRNLRKEGRINQVTKDSFLYLEFMFNYTNDTLYEKNMAVAQFKFLLDGFGDIFLKATKGFNYYYKIIDLYLNCDIISQENKNIFRNIKSKLIKHENNLKNSTHY